MPDVHATVTAQENGRWVVRESTVTWPAPSVEVDEHASYLRLTGGAVAKTLDFGSLLVDVDADGRAVGFEVLR